MSSEKTRVLEDGSGRRAAFEDIEIGRSLGEMEWEITDDLIDLQCLLDQGVALIFFCFSFKLARLTKHLVGSSMRHYPSNRNRSSYQPVRKA